MKVDIEISEISIIYETLLIFFVMKYYNINIVSINAIETPGRLNLPHLHIIFKCHKTMNNQLNIALILLSKVWSSKFSIFIAWKYYFGSKYPLAIKNVCRSTSSLILASS